MLCRETVVAESHLDSALGSAVDGYRGKKIRSESARFGIKGQNNQRDDCIAGGKLQWFDVGRRIAGAVVREEDARRDDQERKRRLVDGLQPSERGLAGAFNERIPEAF